MFLKSLSLLNFKNYQQSELQFNSRINCFTGNNGVGKTNILDAIHYLALCKSYFNVVDSQNITHDQEFSVIQGEFEGEVKTDLVYCGIQKNKRKQFRRNKKEYQKLSEHIGIFPLVMISPSDSALIIGGGEERRKFLNGVISQYDKNYLDDVLSYNHVLAQRNKLLKTISLQGSSALEMLDIYDGQLVDFGTRVFETRKEFIEQIRPVFSRYYNYISGNGENADLIYESQLLNNSFLHLLESNRQRDRMLQYTSTGIHRDDMEMLLGAYPLKKIGSQGQQKTYQVALKLGKFEFIRQVSGITPILLLDDIFDKFDAQRVEQIIRLVSENTFGQIFITDTDTERMKNILGRIGIEHRIFNINKEQLIEEII